MSNFKKRLCSVTILVMVFFSACESEDNVMGSREINEFPLTIGNSWTYDWNTDDERFPEDLLNQTINIKIIGKSEINDIETYEFNTYSELEPELNSTHHYFQDENGLNLLAYEIAANSDANARILNSIADYLLKDPLNFNMTSVNELVVENPPRNTYNFPFELDKKWILWGEPEKEYANKTVIGFEEISVAAGRFNCYKIEYGGPWYDSSKISSTEYISNIGLIKRVISLNVDRKDDKGKIIGTQQVNVAVELKEYSLN